jgi:hypothetical protein
MAVLRHRHRAEITRGATFAHVFTWKNSAGTAVDVTGYTAEFTIDNRDGTEAVQVTSASGAITLGGTAGTITSTLTAVQTAALTHAAAHGGMYSLVLTSSGGAIVPVASGPVAILEVPGL